MTLQAHFSLPPLSCSFPPKLHPEYERVRTECDPWILNLAHPNVRQILQDSLLPLLACRIFPITPNLSRLNNIAKLIGWLTLADDLVDIGPLILPTNDSDSCKGDSSHDLSPTSWAQCVLSKLQYPDNDTITSAPCGHRERESLILLGALGELWRDISSQITPQARARFIKTIQHHLEAICLERALNSTILPQRKAYNTGHTISVTEYMDIRRKSSAFLMGPDLLHYALGLDEDLIHLIPLLEELQCLAIDYMCMCNDLVSCRQELSSGTYFNLPYILYHNGSVESLQDAVETVVEMVERVDARSVVVVNAIKRDHAVLMEKEPKLKAYLENLVSFMSGSLCWSFETARYGLCDTKASL